MRSSLAGRLPTRRSTRWPMRWPRSMTTIRGAPWPTSTAAQDALDAVRDWEEPPAVLPFWLDTTGELLSAARRIATASLAGDADAVARAADRYARAADDANRADTALAIAIAESGSSLAATPLQRLADALEAATTQRQELSEMLAGR